MNPTLWSLLGGSAAIAGEYFYRTMPGSFWSNAWLFVPLNLLVAFAVWHIVRVPNTSLLHAFIVWTFATMVCRIGVTVFLLHDKVSVGTWVALGLIVVARICNHFWK